MSAKAATAQRILMTGFGSFPGVAVNVTSQFVPLLAEAAAQHFPASAVSFDILPVTWGGGPERSACLVEDLLPDLIVHFGVSERASGFVIETLARNTCQLAPDAAGYLPPLELLDAGAPAHLESTLPSADILKRLTDGGLPAYLSNDAGQYLCNAVLFHTLCSARHGVRAGFIHLPVSFDAPGDALSMDDAIRGGLGILDVCLMVSKSS